MVTRPRLFLRRGKQDHRQTRKPNLCSDLHRQMSTRTSIDSSRLNDLVNTAEFLIKAVQDSYAFVVRNQIKVAVLLIPGSRKEDGRYLSEIAGSQKKHLELQLERYIDERILSLNNLGVQRKERDRLEKQKSNLLQKECVLKDDKERIEHEIKCAEVNLEEARIREARLKEKQGKDSLMLIGGFSGAILGSLFGPLGVIAGSSIGFSGTAWYYGYREKDAKETVLKYRKELDSHEIQIKDIKKSIESVEKDIKLCEEAIRDCDNKIAMTEDNITTVDRSIQFTENVICLWKFFNIYSQTPYCINKLQEVVQMVEIRQKCQILTSEGTMIVEDTFLSAWKVIIKNSSHQCIDKRYAIINKIMHYTSADVGHQLSM